MQIGPHNIPIILNSEATSESPSTKSMGLRFISATVIKTVIKKPKNIDTKIIIFHIYTCENQLNQPMNIFSLKLSI